MTDVTAVALAEEQTDQIEEAGDARVELEEVIQDGETARAEIAADAAIAIAETEAENGVDEEWLRSQFDAVNNRQAEAMTAMLGLTEAVSNLTTLLAAQSTPTVLAEPEPILEPVIPSEPVTVEPAPEPVVNVKTRRTVLF